MKANQLLITLAETADEALSDFIGFQKDEPEMHLIKSSLCKLADLHGDNEIVNIIDFNNELPEDTDGWYAVRYGL